MVTQSGNRLIHQYEDTRCEESAFIPYAYSEGQGHPMHPNVSVYKTPKSDLLPHIQQVLSADNVSYMKNYHMYPKYWVSLAPYNTCKRCPFDNLLMCQKPA